MAELFLRDGLVRWASLSSAVQGQRMAALPCALVARAFCDEHDQCFGDGDGLRLPWRGPLLDMLVKEGFDLHRGAQHANALPGFLF